MHMSEAIMQEKLQKLADQQRELEKRYLQIEKQNSDLTNLIVASQSLHASLDRRQVLSSIQEIIINLLGSEELAVFEVSNDGKQLDLVDSFGVEAKKFASIPIENTTIGQVTREGQAKVDDAESKKHEGLTACVPLMLGNKAVGAVAVFKLLPQKSGELQQLDHDLLEVLRSQAGLALYCTRLVQKRAEEP
jgi:hypothetical protein